MRLRFPDIYSKTILFVGALLLSFSLIGQTVPERPSPQRLVNNLSTEYSSFLAENETEQLEEKLESFSNETSNQICIIIIDSLWGFSTADFCERILTTWGVGKKDKNNGIVILIKPTGGAGQRDAFIATGYGLEGAIPDLTCKKIVDTELLPNLKEGNPYVALDKATDVLMALAKGEYNSKDYSRRAHGNKKGKNISWGWIIIFVIIVFIIRMIKGGGGGGYTYRGSGWRGGGGWIVGGGGGWSSGSGGGWGGFGGGSGGGGGAGGKW